MDIVLETKCFRPSFQVPCFIPPNIIILSHGDEYGFCIFSPGSELVGAGFKKHGQMFYAAEVRYVFCRATSLPLLNKVEVFVFCVCSICKAQSVFHQDPELTTLCQTVVTYGLLCKVVCGPGTHDLMPHVPMYSTDPLSCFHICTDCT